MKPLPPVDVVPLFPDERATLLDLLRSLTPEQWALSTVCDGWSVKDIGAHLVADDLGRLGWQRDGHSGNRFEASSPETFEAELRDFINAQNELCVAASRRFSPRVIIDMLEWSGRETQVLFESLDPNAMGLGVSWAGETESANWFDLAREYTERWHHQAQIRDAVAAPMLYEKRLYRPVLQTLIRAIPHAMRGVDAEDGTVLALVVTEMGPTEWFVVRAGGEWQLMAPSYGEIHGEFPGDYHTFVALYPDLAWRVFTRTIPIENAKEKALIVGTASLAEALLQTFALVA